MAAAAALICAAALLFRLLVDKGGALGADTAPQSLPEGEFADRGGQEAGVVRRGQKAHLALLADIISLVISSRIVLTFSY